MVLLQQLLSMRLTLLMLLALAFQLVVVGTVAALSLAVQYTKIQRCHVLFSLLLLLLLLLFASGSHNLLLNPFTLPFTLLLLLMVMLLLLLLLRFSLLRRERWQ